MPTARIILEKSGKNKGLGKDSEVFKKYLENRGFEVFQEYSDIINSPDHGNDTIYDLQICLENIFTSYLPYGRYNALMVNQDISFSGPPDAIDLYICKTLYCYDRVHKFLSKNKIKSQVIYTSFLTADSKTPLGNSEKLPFALHSAGESPYKCTEELIDLWSRHPEWPPLHIIGTKWHEKVVSRKIIPLNIITYQSRLSEEELDSLRNTASLYVCPSHKEGWGHYLDEGRIRAVPIITTNAPPMNQLCRYSSLLVDVKRVEKDNKISKHDLETSLFFFDEKSMEEVMERFLKMSPEERRKEGEENWRSFQEDRIYFKTKGMQKIVEGFTSSHSNNYQNIYYPKMRKIKRTIIFLILLVLLIMKIKR